MQNFNVAEKLNFSNLLRRQKGKLIDAYLSQFRIGRSAFYSRFKDVEFTEQEKKFFREWFATEELEWIEPFEEEKKDEIKITPNRNAKGDNKAVWFKGKEVFRGTAEECEKFVKASKSLLDIA